jgi:hypothetical protein
VKAITVYERATGRLLRVLRGDGFEHNSQANSGEAIYEGALPLQGCRIDPATGQPEYFVPPAPDSDHSWNAEAATFIVSEVGEKRRTARSRIEALEKQQSRAIREQAIGRGGTPAQLKKRLEDIDDQIAALRAQLNET